MNHTDFLRKIFSHSFVHPLFSCRQSGQPIRHAADAQLDGLEDLQPVEAERRGRRGLRLGQAARHRRRRRRQRKHQAHQATPDPQHYSLKEGEDCGLATPDYGLDSRIVDSIPGSLTQIPGNSKMNPLQNPSSPDRIIASTTPSRKQCCDPTTTTTTTNNNNNNNPDRQTSKQEKT